MMNLSQRSHRRCFTLMEVMISIALAMALLGAVFGFLFNLLATRQRVIEFAAQQRAAAILIERIERDLVFTLVGDSRSGAGIQGDASSLRLLTRSVAVNLADQVGRDREVFGDLQAIHYRFDEGRRSLQVGRISQNQNSGTSSSPLEDLRGNIFRVRFRYYDGDSWLESFDSRQANQLPVAIEIAFWFDPWPGEESEGGDGSGGAGGAGRDPDPESLDFLRRETFDARAGFDEESMARITDLELVDEPEPDRQQQNIRRAASREPDRRILKPIAGGRARQQRP